MSHGPFWIRRPKPTRLAQLLDEQRSASLSYPEVGATAGHLPSGYHTVREALVLGRGQGVFERAAEGIRAWACAPPRQTGNFPITWSYWRWASPIASREYTSSDCRLAWPE